MSLGPLECHGVLHFAQEEQAPAGLVDNQHQEGPVEADGARGAVLGPGAELGGGGRRGLGPLLADGQHGLVGSLPREELSFGVLPGGGAAPSRGFRITVCCARLAWGRPRRGQWSSLLPHRPLSAEVNRHQHRPEPPRLSPVVRLVVAKVTQVPCASLFMSMRATTGLRAAGTEGNDPKCPHATASATTVARDT